MRIQYVLKRGLFIGLTAMFAATVLANPVVSLSDTAKVVGKSEQGVDAFLGIPYAQAPIGALRWQLPQPAKPIQGTFQATQEGAICPQWQQGKFEGKEDCLNLDVYRPEHAKHELPVLVYIHGGNNQTGEAHEFNPQALAKALNAVIVQVNYRLGVLGFNPLKALKTEQPIQASGNFGLLDQLAALQWVHQNIQHFGGRADQVTVAGFSAGGRDVMAMLISPLFKGKFQHAIVFSGGMTTAPVAPSQQVFRQAFAPLVVRDHIQPNIASAQAWLASGGKAVRDYLQQLPAEQLAPLMKGAGIRMSHFPHLYRDGAVIPKQGFATTDYNSVPVIMLSGQTEFSIFALTDPYFVKAWHDGTLMNDPDMLTKYQFVYHYGGKLYSLFNVQQSAQRMFAHYKAPIYATEVAFGDDPLVTRNEQMALLGAFHGVFMPLLDRTWRQALLGKVFQQPGAVDLSKQFRRYLAHFIRTGNPNGQHLVRWLPWSPKHDNQGQSLLVLNANRHKALIQMSSKSYDEAVLLDAMAKDHHLSDQAKQEMIDQVLNGRWFSNSLDKRFHVPSLWPKS